MQIVCNPQFETVSDMYRFHKDSFSVLAVIDKDERMKTMHILTELD